MSTLQTGPREESEIDQVFLTVPEIFMRQSAAPLHRQKPEISVQFCLLDLSAKKSMNTQGRGVKVGHAKGLTNGLVMLNEAKEKERKKQGGESRKQGWISADINDAVIAHWI